MEKLMRCSSRKYLCCAFLGETSVRAKTRNDIRTKIYSSVQSASGAQSDQVEPVVRQSFVCTVNSIRKRLHGEKGEFKGCRGKYAELQRTTY